MRFDCSKCDAHFECNATAACRCDNESVMTITEEQLKILASIANCCGCPCAEKCNSENESRSCFDLLKGWLEANT